ncbi:MAG: hypothetical protein ACRCT2_16260 [Plesiomonas shigelloides]
MSLRQLWHVPWVVSMSTMVAQERHLVLNLAQMSEVQKTRLLDAAISQAGLFVDTMEDMEQQCSAVQKQIEAIEQILPRHDVATPRSSRSGE